MNKLEQLIALQQEFDRLRAVVEKELAEWNELAEQVEALYARARTDPEAAQRVIRLEAMLRARRNEDEAMRQKMRQARKLMKELQLKIQQDGRDTQGKTGEAVLEKHSAEPPAERRRPARKAGRRYA